MIISEQTKKSVIHETFPYDKIEPLKPDLDTIPKWFIATARRYPKEIAIRKKRYGIWQEYTWQDSFNHVRDFCLGLVSLGLKRGERIAIIGENDPEFYWAEFAIHSAGGTTTAIFTDANPQELLYVITDSDAVFLLAHDQEQCDKALELKDKMPNIRKVIYWDDSGLWNYDDPWLISWDEVEALGKEYGQKNPNKFEELVKQGSPDEYAIFSYTSGTSGLPKGAMVKHCNLLYNVEHSKNVLKTYQTASSAPAIPA